MFALLSVIKDPIIRSFTKKSQQAYLALKVYASQTEDRDLEVKLNIVEKYGNRIPELVNRLERCFEKDFTKAGMQKNHEVIC